MIVYHKTVLLSQWRVLVLLNGKYSFYIFLTLDDLKKTQIPPSTFHTSPDLLSTRTCYTSVRLQRNPRINIIHHHPPDPVLVLPAWLLACLAHPWPGS